MALNLLNSSNLEQLALKGLSCEWLFIIPVAVNNSGCIGDIENQRGYVAIFVILLTC